MPSPAQHDPHHHDPSAQHDPHRPSSPTRRVGAALRRVSRAYSPHEDRALGGHLGAVVAFGAYAAAWGAAAHLRGAKPAGRPGPWDVLLTGAAAFRLSRLIGKGTVTSPLRAPFTRFEEATGPAEVNESPRGGAVRSTVGELITCPFCLGVWVTTTFTGAQALWPRATRTVTASLTALAVADALQLGYDCLLQKNTE